MSIAERQKVRNEEMRHWQEAQQDAREEAEAAGEEYKGEVRVFEEITAQPFKSEQVQFVVCLNTMG